MVNLVLGLQIFVPTIRELITAALTRSRVATLDVQHRIGFLQEPDNRSDLDGKAGWTLGGYAHHVVDETESIFECARPGGPLSGVLLHSALQPEGNPSRQKSAKSAASGKSR